MSALQKAITNRRAFDSSVRQFGEDSFQKGMLNDILTPSQNFSGFEFSSQMGNQSRYSLFRGWVYAAINALAEAGAGQPVHVGELKKGKKLNRSRLAMQMTKTAAAKSSELELNILPESPLLAALEQPNRIQYRWQFVYSFIANLALTGWGYVVGEKNEEGDFEFYSLPTTWVRPDHSKGAFQLFRIVNPNKPEEASSSPPLTADQVAFAYLPNPADPMKALAPAEAQQMAVKIDDNIQSSQGQFFDKGIFPSAIITMGRNPHPEVPGGIRPRLTAAQRREVYSAIRKVSGGVSNYGNPAIVDGLIEKIERLTPTHNEMGWERSEKAVRTRILSAFAVHPFMLGDEMAGSYAQAYVVQDRFCSKVNTYLDLLGTVMSQFGGKMVEPKKKILVWWDKCKASDPGLEHKLWQSARDRGDISQDTMLAYMGLPPDADKNQNFIDRMTAPTIAKIAEAVTKGSITPEQGIKILIGMGLPTPMAEEIAGKGPDKDTPPPVDNNLPEEQGNTLDVQESDLSNHPSEQAPA